MPATKPHVRPRGNAWTIVLLGALCIISPFATDMYLPAFAAIAQEFHSNTAAIAYTLSIYFTGFSLGQLLYGPLLDRYGRKRPLAVGLVAFVITSIGCAAARDLHAFIALRFVEALAVCVAQVAAIAMVKDFFPAKESARVFSLLFLMIGSSPLLAPTLGSLIIVSVGWRVIFYALAAMAFVILVIVLTLLPEPHQPDPSVSLLPGPMVRSFLHIFRNPQFFTYTLAGGFSLAGLFAFVAASPIIFIDGYGVSPKGFGVVFAVLVMGFIGGNQVNIFLLKRFSSQHIFHVALAVQFVTAILYFAGSTMHMLNMQATMVLFFVFLSCVGFTYPNSAAIALAPYAAHAGRASALLGFLQTGAGALVATGIGVLGSKSIVALLASSPVVAMAILAIGSRFTGPIVQGDDNVVVVH